MSVSVLVWTLYTQGHKIRIAFNTVQEETGQTHHEITGRLPALNTILQEAVRTGPAQHADLDLLMAKARSSLQVLADFCQQFALIPQEDPTKK